MKDIFITGTDTAVGKTMVSGLYARYLLDKGYTCITQKWIQTGSKNFPSDLQDHLKLMKKEKDYVENYLPHVAPYTFGFASSPHLAARLEKRKININKIKRSFTMLSKKFDFVIVEGVGGVLVPFDNKRLVIDIVKDLELPVLIVAKNKLGAINHTLLTVEALKARNIKIAGIIFNNIDGRENKNILKDNLQIIKQLTKETVFGALPASKNHEVLYKIFQPLGDKIFNKLNRK